MFKVFVFAAILAIAVASPAPEPSPKADPKAQLLAAAYSAPLVAASLPLTAAYSAPLTYSSYVAAPSVYAAGYAYSPYASYVL